MRIVVTGANGQVGWELVRSLATVGEVVGLDRKALDLTDLDRIGSRLDDLRPDVIVNAAAYTAVDRAEAECDLADRVNGTAVGIIGEAAARNRALMIHYSTDYVFDGSKPTPYTESDAVAPLNAYGRSKLLGENALHASKCDWLVFRTTWVYGSHGNNFLQTILRLAKERESLRIIADQHGAPTTARFLADATARIIGVAQHERGLGSFVPGLYHLTAGGRTTWHGFASGIVDDVRRIDPSIVLKVNQIDAITSDEYPTAAKRPGNSMLSNDRVVERFRVVRPDWREGMATTLQDVVSR